MLRPTTPHSRALTNTRYIERSEKQPAQMKTASRLIPWVVGLGLSWPVWSSEPGLVAHYNFDEGTGQVLRDASGNGNDGQIHGARYIRRGRGIASSSTAWARV